MSDREWAFEQYLLKVGALHELDRESAEADFNAGWDAREAVQS